MSQEDWASKLVDRIPNSPAAERMFIEQCPIRLDGELHSIGPRITEVCALIGRAVKQRADLAVFLPAPDTVDVLSTLIYLYILRRAIVSQRAAPGRWASPQVLTVRRDLWLLGNVSRLRNALLRLTLENRPLTTKLRCAWFTHKQGQALIDSIGAVELPAACLFASDALLQGSLSPALAGLAPPFATLVDAAGMNEGRELARHLTRLRHLSQDAPVIVLGALGDKITIIQARRSQLPIWILRAGDAARLTQLEAQRSSEVTSLVAMRASGTDLASARLIQGIRVEVIVLESSATHRLIGPLLQAVQQLERAATDQSQLVSQARALARALLQLAVPWKLYAESLIARARVGRFATPSLESRLQLLRESEPATGEATEALRCVVKRAEAAFEVLSAGQSVTGKERALLATASTAQAAHQGLCIACANETTQRAVQSFLGEHDVNVISGHIRVLTRAQLRRAVAEGAQPPGPDLLVLEPLAFEAGFYFSGISECVRLHIYDLERQTLEKQLNYIAHDIHSTSAPLGDKRAWIIGTKLPTITATGALNGVPADTELDDTAPLWDVQYTVLSEPAVLRGKLPELEPFTLPSTDWLQKTLEESNDEPDPEHHQTEGCAPALSAHVLLTLDDDEPPAILLPDSPILLLLNSPEDTAKGAPLEDLETSGEGAILAREARNGMMVLIPRRTVGGELLDRLLERFDLSADYITAGHFRQMWRDAVALLADRTNNCATTAFALLAQHDLPVTTTRTVQYWMRGLVVGPRDAASIRAVGLATGRSELARHYELIHAALAHIRSCRIAIARRLIEYVRAGKSLGPDAVIDEHLGLRRADLDEVTRIGRITSVTLAPAARSAP